MTRHWELTQQLTALYWQETFSAVETTAATTWWACRQIATIIGGNCGLGPDVRRSFWKGRQRLQTWWLVPAFSKTSKMSCAGLTATTAVATMALAKFRWFIVWLSESLSCCFEVWSFQGATSKGMVVWWPWSSSSSGICIGHSVFQQHLFCVPQSVLIASC